MSLCTESSVTPESRNTKNSISQHTAPSTELRRIGVCVSVFVWHSNNVEHTWKPTISFTGIAVLAFATQHARIHKKHRVHCHRRFAWHFLISSSTIPPVEVLVPANFACPVSLSHCPIPHCFPCSEKNIIFFPPFLRVMHRQSNVRRNGIDFECVCWRNEKTIE